MGKRSNFEKIDKDKYRTPYRAVVPLLPFLAPKTRFAAPCAGDGRLIRHLTQHGHICEYAADIEPDAKGILKRSAFDLIDSPCGLVIENPPWTRSILEPMIEHFMKLGDAWLLFDSDWSNNLDAVPLGRAYCRDIVPIGRVKWIEGSKHGGKDNCSWYRFSPAPGPTIFHFRREKIKI